MSDTADMRKGTCPKCGAKDIRCHLSSNYANDLIWVALLRTAKTDRYVCVACGYMECYVDQAGRAKIAKKWNSVTPQA